MAGKWGLVLAGGGGKGSYQAGVFKAMEELGFRDRIQAVAGTSIGAFNGSLFLSLSAEKIISIWKSVSLDQFLTPDNDISNDGFFTREGMGNILYANVPAGRLGGGDTPFFTCACRLTDTEYGAQYVPEYFRMNECTDAEALMRILASSAVPFAYESVAINGGRYLDGGLKDNVPVKPIMNWLGEQDPANPDHILVIRLDTEPIAFPRWDGEILEIRPTHDVGGFLTGTADFTPEGARFRIELGYRDALRILKAYESGDIYKPDFAYRNRLAAERDFELIRQDLRRNELQDEINSKMSAIDELLKKYT